MIISIFNYENWYKTEVSGFNNNIEYSGLRNIIRACPKTIIQLR